MAAEGVAPTLRGYVAGDADAVVQVWRQASRRAHHFLPDEFFSREEATIRREYLPLAQTTVATRDDCIVGFISLVEDQVGGLFVDPREQGRGVGTLLLDHAKRGHPDGLHLEVLAGNHGARRFYERRGFVAVAEGVDPAAGVPALRMRWPGEPPAG